ncbi:MAG: helix-turn-helix domain-containing protein, partial [Sphingopyxis sp.]
MAGEVRSVSQAFAVLRLLADNAPMTLSDIGRSLGLGASSCFNLLGTLVAEGAVVRDAPGKRYRLSDGWAQAGLLRDGDARRMVDRLRPLMMRFAQAQGVTAGLWQVASRD